MYNLGFIGAGNMGGEIIRGFLNADNKKYSTQIYCYRKHIERVAELGEAVIAAESMKELLEKCKYVVLAVKPQILPEILEEIQPFVTAETVLISICAGISADFIRSRTIPNAKVVLIMPNTPVKLGFGSTAAARCEGVSDEEFDFAFNIFAAVGEVVQVPENKMNEVIALNGSSPAFIFTFAKGFLKFATESGFDDKDALKLLGEAFVGAGKMLQFSGQTADEMIKAVSSPGGTTLAGLAVLNEADIEKSAYDACKACTKRAYELAK